MQAVNMYSLCLLGNFDLFRVMGTFIFSGNDAERIYINQGAIQLLYKAAERKIDIRGVCRDGDFVELFLMLCFRIFMFAWSNAVWAPTYWYTSEVELRYV